MQYNIVILLIFSLLWATATICIANDGDASLTAEQQALIRQLALQIWPSDVVNHWHMDNRYLAQMIIDATKSLGRCDRAMNKVYELMINLTFSTLSKSVRPIVKHLMKMKKANSGMACRNAVAARFRSAIEIANLSLD
ncbi:unnamed protein product [Rotaria sordida]|uniref:Uncharacterized protein n=1 Tax=Rotaria sordida TaxID=392033 RepID=A0A814Z143_9BILA|nr:unnamed protein product [Rotaria sordida]CAF1343922.1 unnamed protein product [Rotaria sordida]CAF1598302.1 unnamed protein product [Rotaria sordida]CAF3933617.1 unnamed protein product [Rotaria sordida]